MTSLKCPMCAGTLTFHEAENCYICDFCDTPISASEFSDEKISQLKERANKLFLSCDFDGAAALYQSVVAEDTNDAKSYWLLALCAYGIQYVDDPLTRKRIPTCHRTSYSSILNNEDYLNAIDCADLLTKKAYEEAARRIDTIQQGILNIVSKESPYDVFICYKETSESGFRTRESDIAKDLYYKLTAEGYRTFYAPITLQEKAGMEYEPFIFAALNSAKVMFVIGFSKKHYEAVWVKNEWSRFLARKSKNPRLLIIPCYNSLVMDAAELPALLAKTQAKDLANASTNDLVLDLKKRMPLKKEETAKPDYNIASVMGGNASALLKRGFIYLEDGEFSEAADCFNKSLDLNPELSKAYWGVVLSIHKCRTNAELSTSGIAIHEMNEFKKALRFANDIEREEYETVLNNIQNKINKTVAALKKSRNDRVLSTNVQKVLEESKENIERLEKEYSQLMEELRTLEEELQTRVSECEAVINPLSQEVKGFVQQFDKIIVELNKTEKSVNDVEYIALKKQILSAKERFDQISDVEYDKCLKENSCFARVDALLKQQQAVTDSLDALSKRIRSQTSDLERLTSKIQAIEEEYELAFEQVPTGQYSLVEKLLHSATKVQD